MAATPFTSLVLPDGHAFLLPVRRDPASRKVALFLVPFGLMFTVVPIATAAGFAAFSPGPFAVISGLFTLPFLFIGFACALVGALLVWGRTEVRVDRGRLVATERLGPFRISRRRSAEWVQELHVVGDGFRVNGQPVKTADGDDFALLRATGESGKPFIVTAMYPKAALSALAHELAGLCDAQTPDALFDAGAPRVVEIASEHEEAPAEVEQPIDRPADCRIELTRDGGALTFRLPAPGLVRGSKGLFIFALLWNGFMVVFTGAFVYSLAFQPQSVTINGPGWTIYAFFAVFWLVGAWMLVYAMSLGRRIAAIDIVGDTLLITEQRLRRTKQWEWRTAELASIRVGPSGMEVNNKPVNCLLIESTDGKTRKLFAERRDDDLRWMASVLRVSLGLARG